THSSDARLGSFGQKHARPRLACGRCGPAVNPLTPFPTRMPRAFKYDVAITAADFDALAVAEIKRRLEQRLTKPVFAAPRAADQARTATAVSGTTARKSIEKEARVVVVLFQRLWGTTPSTAADAVALKS